MKYAYENMSEEQFELLVLAICKKLLGISVQGFAKGPDGGRDAKFHGVAELHPSKADPWRGITVVQAKHTNGYNRSFSESDFFNPNSENTVIGKEKPRIQGLRSKGQLDNYMIFSNRRLTGNTETEIRSHISKTCNIPESSLYLVGIEQIESYLKDFPEIIDQVKLDPVDSPLIVSPNDLAEVIEALARQKDVLVAAAAKPPVPRVDYETKNALNNMTPEYAKEQRKRFLKETAVIDAFLSAPENFELTSLYESITEEFHLKILSKKKDYQTFDEIMEYLFDLLISRDPILRKRHHKRLTRVMLFYMYWNCDIGITENAST